jgi:hypothetical protein
MDLPFPYDSSLSLATTMGSKWGVGTTHATYTGLKDDIWGRQQHLLCSDKPLRGRVVKSRTSLKVLRERVLCAKCRQRLLAPASRRSA